MQHEIVQNHSFLMPFALCLVPYASYLVPFASSMKALTIRKLTPRRNEARTVHGHLRRRDPVGQVRHFDMTLYADDVRLTISRGHSR